MADPIVIRTQQDAQEPIEFRVNDEVFKWTPVHTGGLLVALMEYTDGDSAEGAIPAEALAAVGVVREVLFEGLDESEHARLKRTLRFVEISDIMALVEGLLEVVTARPTRSD